MPEGIWGMHWLRFRRDSERKQMCCTEEPWGRECVTHSKGNQNEGTEVWNSSPGAQSLPHTVLQLAANSAPRELAAGTPLPMVPGDAELCTRSSEIMALEIVHNSYNDHMWGVFIWMHAVYLDMKRKIMKTTSMIELSCYLKTFSNLLFNSCLQTCLAYHAADLFGGSWPVKFARFAELYSHHHNCMALS